MALAELAGQQVTRGDSAALAERVRWMAASSYAVEFDQQVDCPSGCCGPPVRPRAMAWKTRDSCALATAKK